MASKTSTTTTTTTKQAERALARAKDVTTEEERVVRMRQGVTVDPKAPLARKAPENSEVADELLLMEMQLLKAYRAHLAAQKAKPKTVSKPRAAAAVATARPPSGNRTKDKIVRALRSKKS